MQGLAPQRRGKVRDIYDLGDRLLLVASDRISAFDCILTPDIPDKGRVLTQLSAYWFHRTGDIVPNHYVTMETDEYPEPLARHRDALTGRSMLVQTATPVPVECVARGYLAGSAWKEYTAGGEVCGVSLPPGLRESDPLPEPIFTPATKATEGHDINISEAEAGRLVGADLVAQLRTLTLALYRRGARHAAERGLILADTKFEFGHAADGTLLLIDEVMTPDSARYWPKDQYHPGGPQPSFDKQFVRDYLEGLPWDKQPPVPPLPPDVVDGTRRRYLEAFERLTGRTLH